MRKYDKSSGRNKTKKQQITPYHFIWYLGCSRENKWINNRRNLGGEGEGDG
jgi:hypothetical protein